MYVCKISVYMYDIFQIEMLEMAAPVDCIELWVSPDEGGRRSTPLPKCIIPPPW